MPQVRARRAAFSAELTLKKKKKRSRDNRTVRPFHPGPDSIPPYQATKRTEGTYGDRVSPAGRRTSKRNEYKEEGGDGGEESWAFQPCARCALRRALPLGERVCVHRGAPPASRQPAATATQKSNRIPAVNTSALHRRRRRCSACL